MTDQPVIFHEREPACGNGIKSPDDDRETDGLGELVGSFWTRFSKREISEIEVVPMGWRNSSFCVTDRCGERFVLKIYDPGFLSDEVLRRNVDIVSRLENDGLPVLRIIPGLDGSKPQFLTRERGARYQALCSLFDDNELFRAREVNEVMIRSMGRELGRMHRALTDCGFSFEAREISLKERFGEMMSAETIGVFREYFAAERLGDEAFVQGFCNGYLRECEANLAYFRMRGEDMAVQMIHGDYNLGNIIFDRQGRVSTILDFDELCIAPISFEIGRALVQLDQGIVSLENLIEIFLEEYETGNVSFNSVDKEAVGMFMRFRCAYRIYRYFTYYRDHNRASGRYVDYRSYFERLKRYRSQFCSL